MPQKRNSTVAKQSTNAKRAHTSNSQQRKSREAYKRSSVIIDALKNMDNANDFQMLPWDHDTRFLQEMQDALVIEQSMPLDPVGYLYASAIFSVRGNNQDALSRLETGIQNASPNNSLYPMLEYQKSRIEKQVQLWPPDWINKVPNEVLLRITDGVDDETRLQCLRVCRRWRSILLRACYLWQQLVIEDEHYQHRKKGNIGLDCATVLLPAIAHHVRSMVFKTTSLKETVVFFTFMSTLDFSHLRSLSLVTYSFGRARSMGEPVYNALGHVSETLTELSIRSGHLKLSLYRILSICRKLTAIRLTVHSFLEISAQNNASLDLLTHPTALTEIDIYTNDPSTSYKRLGSLFQHSPELRFLRLHDPRNEALEAIQDRCPKLVVLIINPRTNNNSFGEAGHNAYPTDFSSHSGLRFMMLGDIPSASALSSRMEMYHDTLETLYFCPAEKTVFPNNWTPLWSHVMNNMRSLHVDINNSATRRSIPAMLQACPNLTTLELKKCSEPADILDTVTDKLSCLMLHRVNVTGRDLRKILGLQATLRRLEIYNCHGIMDYLGAHLAGFKALQQLTLWDFRDTHKQDLNGYTKQIAELPNLYRLELGGGTMSADAARNLVQSKSLDQVAFAYVREILDEHEEILRNRFTHVSIKKH
ncbi:hypothetical protein BJV82DRAFT_663576 [Fennellomyces sp. T-0311]|nr:hypothetical protein BJV82DRAFT_663576 [Fennellomyces sp. T-0311]